MIMYKFTSILAGCGSVFLLPTVLGAAEAPFSGNTLSDYLERATAANPDLQAYEQRYRAALQRVPQASALPDPRLQVTHFVESVQTRTGPQDDAFMLTQMVPWFGKLGNREAMASAEAEALWYAFQTRQLALARSVATAFFEYGFTGKAIELTRENLELLNRLDPVVEERVRAGGDLNPLLRLRVEIGKVDDRLKSLEQKRETQSARIFALLAAPSDPTLSWPQWEPPEPAELNGMALVHALEANNPELAMLDRKIASAKARREIARLEGYPDFTLGVNYVQLGRYAGSALPDAGVDPWGVIVGVSVPIWGGKNKAVREEAVASQTAVEHERRDRENMLKAELTASLASLGDANRRLTLYGEELLNLARQAVEITQTSYESGRATILEVIDSERSLLELQLQYWRAAADAWQNRISVQVLTNQPIAGTSFTTQ